MLSDRPIEYFVKRGFEGPYRSWLKFNGIDVLDSQTEGKTFESVFPNHVYGVEESIDLIVNEIRKSGPYDGVITFSQGSIMFRTLYRVVHEIERDKYQDIRSTFPRFHIGVSEVVFVF